MTGWPDSWVIQSTGTPVLRAEFEIGLTIFKMQGHEDHKEDSKVHKGSKRNFFVDLCVHAPILSVVSIPLWTFVVRIRV